MITMVVSNNDIHENENIELTYWLYYMISYYILQIICIISVRINKENIRFLSISICLFVFVKFFIFTICIDIYIYDSISYVHVK
jgi:hypothetical protein